MHDRPFARREQIGDDGLGDRQQTAAADALQAARQNQRPERRRQRAGDRANDEDADGKQQNSAPAIDVGELAEKRRGGGQSKQIRGDDPRQVVDIAEALADRWQRRRHDGLLERGKEHRQHDASDDGADRRVIERRRLRLAARGMVLASGCEARVSVRAGRNIGGGGVVGRRFTGHVIGNVRQPRASRGQQRHLGKQPAPIGLRGTLMQLPPSQGRGAICGMTAVKRLEIHDENAKLAAHGERTQALRKALWVCGAGNACLTMSLRNEKVVKPSISHCIIPWNPHCGGAHNFSVRRMPLPCMNTSPC